MIDLGHVRRGIPIKFQFNHGNAFAFYFTDPEGNLIEVYWRTGLEYPQPFVQATDLTKTEEELLEELKVLAGQKKTLPRRHFVRRV